MVKRKQNEYQLYEIGYIKNIEQKGKILGIKNYLRFLEVAYYTYLGITITQSLKLKDHENKLRKMENFISTRVNIIQDILKIQKLRSYIHSDAEIEVKLKYWNSYWTWI